MAWAVPAKNGSDVIGRAATGRETIVQFKRAYHGFDPEFVPGGAGVPAARRAGVKIVRWNDAERLEEHAREAGDDLAGILLNPVGDIHESLLWKNEFIYRTGDRKTKLRFWPDARSPRPMTSTRWAGRTPFPGNVAA